MVFHIDHFYNEIMAWKICFTAINSQNKELIFGEICIVVYNILLEKSLSFGMPIGELEHIWCICVPT